MAHNIQKCTKKEVFSVQVCKICHVPPWKIHALPSLLTCWSQLRVPAPDPRPHDPGSVSGAEPKNVAKHDAMVIHLSLESDISGCCVWLPVTEENLKKPRLHFKSQEGLGFVKPEQDWTHRCFVMYMFNICGSYVMRNHSFQKGKTQWFHKNNNTWEFQKVLQVWGLDSQWLLISVAKVWGFPTDETASLQAIFFEIVTAHLGSLLCSH